VDADPLQEARPAFSMMLMRGVPEVKLLQARFELMAMRMAVLWISK